MGIMGVVFLIGWIGMLLYLSRPWDEGLEPGVVFLLIFGLMFAIVMIAHTNFYVRNTFAKNRPSILDIEEETGDQVNDKVGIDSGTTHAGQINFCPYCGKEFKEDFSCCQCCGKKINR